MYLLKPLAMTLSTATDAVRHPITVFELKEIGRQLAAMDNHAETLQSELKTLWEESLLISCVGLNLRIQVW